MSTANVVTLIAFAAFFLAGLAVIVLLDWRQQLPSNLIRRQLQGKVTVLTGKSATVHVAAEFKRARQAARRRRRHSALGVVGYYLARLDVAAGRRGSWWLALVVGISLLLGAMLLIAVDAPLSWPIRLLTLLGFVTVVGITFYRWLMARFHTEFLTQLPDALDTLVRASQAGIPVTEAIRSIGQSAPAPLGPEFLRIGDSLLLGNDLQEVMDMAVDRVALPEFSFFSVCILLQREAGGSVAEALDNLATIIRARRDLMLKTRALTAEGRLSGVVLATLPFLIMALMAFTSPDYIKILFVTDAGRFLLWLAICMLTVGVVAIRKLSRMRM